MPTTLPLLAFNDVYRVRQRFVPQPGSPQGSEQDTAPDSTISVSQFAHLVQSIRSGWKERPRSEKDRNGGESNIVEGDKDSDLIGDEELEEENVERDGLVLFAGDVFNPSVESSVTRGSHMVPVLNLLNVDCACIGNHDFDFGYPHLTKLLASTSFPWLLSNIVDSKTEETPAPLKRYDIIERCGVRIGLIGLVEEDWIATIPSWPKHFKFRSMKEVAIELSKQLRNPQSQHRVDIIIALTHCRVPNDIRLANELGAVVDKPGVENEHGVDLIIGGHDHIYYIGKGAKEWDGYPGDRNAAGTQEDSGVRVIKSGTDFRDLSSALLELSDPNSDSTVIRRRIITSLTGKHHYILPSSPSSDRVENVLTSLLSSVSSTLSKPVCFSLTPFDARSEIVRTRETGLGNWVADVLIHAYAESLMEREDGGGKEFFEKRPEAEDGNENGGDRRPSQNGETQEIDRVDKNRGRESKGGADAVIICGGTLRGDSQYGPGKISLGDILEILPFEDPVVCLEIDGKGIWDTLESALSKWPAQEGRFPIVSGLKVEWDHTLAPGQRVKSIHLVIPSKDHDEIENPADFVDFVEQEDGTRIDIKQRKMKIGDQVKNEEGGRIYRLITRNYMAQGFDGFSPLKGRKFIVDDENGQMMSSIIRSFLLGSSYIFRHKQLFDYHQSHLSSRTDEVLERARQQHRSPLSSLTNSPRQDFRSPPLPDTDSSVSNSSFFSANGGAPMHSPMSEKSIGGTPRRHVVAHDYATISDALHIARHEHMSSVDNCQGQEMRQQWHRPLRSNTKNKTSDRHGHRDLKGDDDDEHKKQRSNDSSLSDFFVDQHRRAELQALDMDVAIVCPLVDGRMKDLAATD